MLASQHHVDPELNTMSQTDTIEADTDNDANIYSTSPQLEIRTDFPEDMFDRISSGGKFNRFGRAVFYTILNICAHLFVFPLMILIYVLYSLLSGRFFVQLYYYVKRKAAEYSERKHERELEQEQEQEQDKERHDLRRDRVPELANEYAQDQMEFYLNQSLENRDMDRDYAHSEDQHHTAGTRGISNYQYRMNDFDSERVQIDKGIDSSLVNGDSHQQYQYQNQHQYQHQNEHQRGDLQKQNQLLKKQQNQSIVGLVPSIPEAGEIDEAVQRNFHGQNLPGREGVFETHAGNAEEETVIFRDLDTGNAYKYVDFTLFLHDFFSHFSTYSHFFSPIDFIFYFLFFIVFFTFHFSLFP